MKAAVERTLSTKQIKALLKGANIDYEATVNKALNSYLARIFLVCPFTNELCLTRKQCLGCKFAQKAT